MKILPFPLRSVILMLPFAMLWSCGGSDSNDDPEPAQKPGSGTETTQKGIQFVATLQSPARATETTFENGDAISVFAVESTNGNQGYLASSGNYASNVKYTYNGSRFTSTNPIEKPVDDQLTYFAVYPYTSAASNIFTFSVNTNQRTKANYTLSDLCTATSASVSTSTVDLPFRHRLSLLSITLDASVGASAATIELQNVYTKASVNLNTGTVSSSGTKGTIAMLPLGNNEYQAVLPPQSISKGTLLANITIGGELFTWNISEAASFASGRAYGYTLTIENGKVEVVFNGYIEPWN